MRLKTILIISSIFIVAPHVYGVLYNYTWLNNEIEIIDKLIISLNELWWILLFYSFYMLILISFLFIKKLKEMMRIIILNLIALSLNLPFLFFIPISFNVDHEKIVLTNRSSSNLKDILIKGDVLKHEFILDLNKGETYKMHPLVSGVGAIFIEYKSNGKVISDTLVSQTGSKIAGHRTYYYFE